MHYHELGHKDALVHLLCAAYMTGILEETMQEVAVAYEVDTINEALSKFNNLKSGLTKLF